jgi:hypothetical protein
MKESLRPKDSRGKSLPKISILGFLVYVVWTTAAWGVGSLLFGDARGLLAIAAGLAAVILYRATRFQGYITRIGTSPSYPARAFIANILLIAIAGYFTYGYASDQYVSYNNRDLLTLVHFAIAELIAVGALVANVISYRRDGQGTGPR